MDATKTKDFVSKSWEETIFKTILDYVRIPNQVRRKQYFHINVAVACL
jgi:hypothetical protein